MANMGEEVMKKYFLVGFMFMVVFVSKIGVVDALSQEYKIGVLALRGSEASHQEWAPIIQYLNNKTGLSFVVVPANFEFLPKLVEERAVHFVFTNSTMYVQMKQLYALSPIATVKVKVGDKELDQFGGVIFTRADSPIRTLQDFKGKNFRCVDFSSFGGWQMAFGLFLENGINPAKDFASLTEVKTHDNVIYSVASGVVDGGTVRTGILEQMVAEGKVKMDQFKIINRVDDNYLFVHSTPLYPEWPMAAVQNTPKEVVDALKKALLEMPGGLEVNKAAQIAGWTSPMDYSAVVKCMQKIRLSLDKKEPQA